QAGVETTQAICCGARAFAGWARRPQRYRRARKTHHGHGRSSSAAKSEPRLCRRAAHWARRRAQGGGDEGGDGGLFGFGQSQTVLAVSLPRALVRVVPIVGGVRLDTEAD